MVASVFGVWDYIIMGATMIGSIAIGMYFRFSGGKQKTNEEYLLANRNLSIFPVAVSLMASFMSAITLLGVTAENYYYGMQFIVINISYGIATPICTHLYLPVFIQLKKTSTYEYLELRFGPTLRLLASLTYTLQMVLYNGIVLYAPAIVLESVTGMDRLISIIVVGLVCTMYSSMGGMKAVVFTDLLQSILMYGAVFSVVVFSAVQVGGFGKIFELAKEGGRLNMYNFSLDPTERHTWWSLLIGGMFTYLSVNAVNHTQIQRLQTVSTLRRSQWCMFWSWPILSIISITTCIAGIGIFAAYKDCDPLSAKSISAIDQLMPYYVVNSMKHIPGLSGLFVAGIFSASLSTISASCNALAAVTLHDYIGRCCTLPPSYVPVMTKLTACAFGLVFLAMAFIAEHLGGVMQAALTIFGCVGGPLIGIFTLGMCTTFANERAASTGLITGIAMTLWFNFGTPRPSPTKLPLSVEGCLKNITLPIVAETDPTSYFYPYRISYMWTCPMGFLWTMAVGIIMSLLWRQQRPWEKAGLSHPDPALFTPLLARRLRANCEEKQSIQCKLLKMNGVVED